LGTRPSYSPEFRSEAVRLVRTSGKSVTAIARELSISRQSLMNWIEQIDINEGKHNGLTTDEREELRRLRRENKTLQMEREILKKAAAFFASEETSRNR
jgi:transposase